MIGGEFEIDITKQSIFVPQPNTYYYASGRTALYQILCSLRPRYQKLWLPDWLCHTMVEAAEKAGYDVRFYNLNEDFKVTVEALDSSGFRDGQAMLMVNYFGLQDLTLSANCVKEAYPKSIVIEDDVQAYWSFEENLNPYADFRFTSVRKSIAVPDGGLVKTNRPMPTATTNNTFSQFKLKAGQMKLCRNQDGIHDEDYLALFEEGERQIDDNYDSNMTDVSKKLYACVDFIKAKKQRQLNASYLLGELALLGIEPIIGVSNNSVPLFIPISLKNRNDVRKAMFQQELFCPVHWPLEGMKLERGKEMAETELSLIVDQRYGLKEMDSIIQVMKKFV